MADGRTHALATETLAAFLFAGQAVSGTIQGEALPFTLLFGSALSLGALVGLILTPDLDVDAGSFSEDEVRELSPFGENFWWIYWFPYRRLVPHRSPLSHWPVIGTLGRLLYLSLAYWAVLLGAYFLDPPFFSWLATWGLWLLALPYFRVCLLGLAAADTLHFFMDQRLFHRFFKQNRTPSRRAVMPDVVRYDG